MKQANLKRLMLTGLLSVSLLLSACASKEDSPAVTTAANSKTEEKTDTTKADSTNADTTEKSESNTESDGAYSSFDLSETIDLTMYMVGDKPTDLEDVLDAANTEYFNPILNTNLSMQFLSWSDYQTKYSLVLAGGDKVDLIYTASWCFYSQEAGKGAFKELDMEWIEEWMPQTAESQAPESWDQMKLNGQIYAVPKNAAGTEIYKIVALRDDIREKNDIPALESFDDYVNYLKIVAENETGIQAIASDGGNMEIERIWRQSQNIFEIPIGLDFGAKFESADKAPSVEDIFYFYSDDSYLNFANQMKELADVGAWSKNAINNSVSDNDSFGQGKGSSIVWNGSVFTYGKQVEDSELGTAGYYDITKNSIVPRANYSGDAFAITSSSENPERAALALDLMKNDFDLNTLLKGGIEGRHYIQNDASTFSEGPEFSDYSWGGWAWALNIEGSPVSSDIPQIQKDTEAAQLARAESLCTMAFTFDEAPVKAEFAVINSIRDEYLPSFQLGAFGEETEAKFQEMNDKFEAAGLQKVLDEFTKQYQKYLDDYDL